MTRRTRTIFLSNGVGQLISVKHEGLGWRKARAELLAEFCANPISWYSQEEIEAAKAELERRGKA